MKERVHPPTHLQCSLVHTQSTQFLHILQEADHKWINTEVNPQLKEHWLVKGDTNLIQFHTVIQGAR